MEDTGILCCFIHLMEETTFFPQEREVLQVNPSLCAQYCVFPQVSEEWGKAEMMKVRSMMLWLQKKPWNLARAWVFSSGDKTRSSWSQTSHHSPPLAVRWQMLTHPSLHWFSLSGFWCVILSWAGISYWGFPFTVHLMKQATELKPGQFCSLQLWPC